MVRDTSDGTGHPLFRKMAREKWHGKWHGTPTFSEVAEPGEMASFRPGDFGIMGVLGSSLSWALLGSSGLFVLGFSPATTRFLTVAERRPLSVAGRAWASRFLRKAMGVPLIPLAIPSQSDGCPVDSPVDSPLIPTVGVPLLALLSLRSVACPVVFPAHRASGATAASAAGSAKLARTPFFAA